MFHICAKYKDFQQNSSKKKFQNITVDADLVDEPKHLTDLGNAKRLIGLYGDDLRYCYPWGKWLIWDGDRWVKDESGTIDRHAKNTVGQIYVEAGQGASEEKRKRLGSHAIRSS